MSSSSLSARPRPSLRDRIVAYPSAVLLAMQVLAVLVYPFIGATQLGRAFLSLIGTLVLGIAIWTIRNTHTHTVPAMVIGAIAVVMSVAEVFAGHNDAVILVSAVAHVLFYFYTSYAMVRYLFGDDWVTNDDLFAVGAAFTLVAWGWAYIYTIVQTLSPGAFTGSDGVSERSWFELLYVSFSNLTGCGLSDIAPITPQSRSWTMLEQFAGVLYVAMVISRMVTLTVRRQRG